MIDGEGSQGLTKDLISLSENKLTYCNCHHLSYLFLILLVNKQIPAEK